MQSHLIAKKVQSPLFLHTARKGMASVYSSSLFSIKHSKSSFFLFLLAFLRGTFPALVMSVLLAFSSPPSVSSLISLSLSRRHPTDHKTMASKSLPPMCLAGTLFLDRDACWWLEGKLWYFQISAPIMSLTVSYN